MYFENIGDICDFSPGFTTSGTYTPAALFLGKWHMKRSFTGPSSMSMQRINVKAECLFKLKQKFFFFFLLLLFLPFTFLLLLKPLLLVTLLTEIFTKKRFVLTEQMDQS